MHRRAAAPWGRREGGAAPHGAAQWGIMTAAEERNERTNGEKETERERRSFEPFPFGGGDEV